MFVNRPNPGPDQPLQPVGFARNRVNVQTLTLEGGSGWIYSVQLIPAAQASRTGTDYDPRAERVAFRQGRAQIVPRGVMI